jgi:hypothetical protein
MSACLADYLRKQRGSLQVGGTPKMAGRDSYENRPPVTCAEQHVP